MRRPRRWHWIVVGLLAGAGFATVWKPAPSTERRRSVGAREFEALLKRAPLRNGATFAANLVVYPGGGGGYLVGFDELLAGPDGKGWRYVPRCFESPGTVAASDGGQTFIASLERMRQEFPHVTYRYAWWAEPRWWYLLWAAACLVVFGGICPAVLRTSRRDAQDHNPPISGTCSPDPQGSSRANDGPDAEQLAELNRAMEASVASGAERTDSHAIPPAAPVSTLSGASEIAPAAVETAEPQQYAGEYYPVARPAGPAPATRAAAARGKVAEGRTEG